MLTATISALKWGYRLIVLAGLALAVYAYLQVRNGAGAFSQDSYTNDIQQALAGLKELVRTLH